MEEEKWVPLYLRYDKESDTVKMKTDNKDDFAVAAGLLMRITLKAVEDNLLEEGEKREHGNQKSNR